MAPGEFQVRQTRMFVIGTAGHIDHGKSVLIHALTGIDPDRLREEKERGMTIDLGFAWMKLPSGQEVGIIDVPGHERFVRNMLAGVGGIDLALLVVAADEGVMAQTREHLAILDLLDIRHGIAVITKKDLVDEGLLDLVKLEVEELLKPTTLAGAPIIAVSAVTGEGLTDLVSAIDHVLTSAQPRRDVGRPRLLIDRVFTIAGAGTVVTGTLIDGMLSVGDEVAIVPSGLKARIRGLQTHKTRIESASPGSRVAANLTGVSTSQVVRGDVLTRPEWLVPTERIDVKLRLLSNLRHPLRHGITVNFYSGAAEVLAKVHLLERDKLAPGEVTWAQFALSKPMALVKGDHFIIRSPVDTLGGGQVVAAHASRHKRFRPAVVQSLRARGEGSTEEVIMATLEMSQPLALGQLGVESGLGSEEVYGVVAGLADKGRVVVVGRGDDCLVFTDAGWQRLVKRAEAVVMDYHQRFPARAGMPKAELSSRLGLAPHSAALQKLFDDGVLVEVAAAARLPSHRVELTPDQQAKIDAYLVALNRNPYSPPGDVTLEPDLLNLLIEQQRVVKVADGVVFPANAYHEMVDKVIARAREQGSITVAGVRDMLGTSRKYAIALLEYMDDKKITRRVGDKRVLR